MTKFFFIFLLFFVLSQPVEASEITGTISTNKNISQNGNNNSSSTQVIDKLDDTKQSVQGNQYIPRRQQVNVNAIKEKEILPVKVLGAEFYEDGSLLRDEVGRIYVIFGNTKKHIRNLDELKKYSGQVIHEVLINDLSLYTERNFVIGELIRAIGHKAVFVVTLNGKTHIKSLEELRKNYFGKEIFNVSEKEMSLY